MLGHADEVARISTEMGRHTPNSLGGGRVHPGFVTPHHPKAWHGTAIVVQIVNLSKQATCNVLNVLKLQKSQLYDA